MAGTIYAFIKGLNMEDTAKIASGFALITLADENTVSPKISKESVAEMVSQI